MFRLIDKPSSGGVTTACFYKTRTHIGPLLRSIVITISHWTFTTYYVNKCVLKSTF
jgi:hypothetical protein